MRSVQTGKDLGADEASRVELTPERRTEHLDRADRLYREIVELDDQSAGKTLIVVTALTGRAAIADSKGDAAQAREFYNAAASRAGDAYPDLAAQARARAESVGTQPPPTSMPSQEQVQAMQPKNPGVSTPVAVEGWIRTLIGDDVEEQSPAMDFGQP
jgi:hypothetical protein